MHTDTSPSPLIFGCMGLGGQWDNSAVNASHILQAEDAVNTALECGITVFDHADIYTMGKAEQVFGEVLKRQPTLRDNMLIQSKCGIRFASDSGPKRYDFSSQWIKQSVEESLQRLGVERLDILLLHRPDPLMQLDDVALAIESLTSEGKIAQLGVSNMHSHQVEYLRQGLGCPIVANQLEMSLAHRDWLEDGITTGSDVNRNNGYAPGTLEYCMMHNVELQAWGSLAQGRFSGGKAEYEEEVATAELVKQLAAEYQTCAEAIVLGWLMRHPANIRPIIGTTQPQRIRRCAEASSISLSREHWYRLLETVRGNPVP